MATKMEPLGTDEKERENLSLDRLNLSTELSISIRK